MRVFLSMMLLLSFSAQAQRVKENIKQQVIDGEEVKVNSTSAASKTKSKKK